MYLNQKQTVKNNNLSKIGLPIFPILASIYCKIKSSGYLLIFVTYVTFLIIHFTLMMN